ncbi:MAG TPA: hydantoinase/oxoprolinase family protein [Kiloniellales bacterium]|nr:hydantoinase/oxoprolinase family protein [Kiloniellales bacterium]
MALLIGIDTGGTYTDAVLWDEAKGVVAKAKALTTKHDLALGIGEALAQVLDGRAREVALVSLSTTLATNALVESHGHPVGLILIGYPPQALERAGLREALRGDPVAFIGGGHGPEGHPLAPLDRGALEHAVAEQEPFVQSYAVAGYFAVRNPAHELEARDLIRKLTGKAVTCAHQLSSGLDAPRRALTAVLNARLVPLIQQLVEAVQGLMAGLGLACPLTVVKGDGSLVSAEVALASPVETILSGPAASVVGAAALAGKDLPTDGTLFVSDIGGTTTDIAVLRQGRPQLSAEGARVGGFRTMVEAVAVHTLGLGGDSEVRVEVHPLQVGTLKVGPRRAQPLSLLARDHPQVLAWLAEQSALEEPSADAGRFALRLRPLPAGAALKPAEARLWQAMAEGPQPVGRLAADYLMKRALQRLLDRGLAILAAFTPSDAAHVLGRQQGWCREAAVLGAAILARLSGHVGPEAVAEAVHRRVVALSAEALLGAALVEEGGPPILPDGLGRVLVDRAFAADAGSGQLFGARLALTRPVLAIGAPAATYYPAVCERLATRLVLPPHAEVCNAVGAVASGIVQRVSLLVTQPEEGRFRAHLPDGIRDFPDLEQAAVVTLSAARDKAAAQARAAGAVDIRLETSRADNVVEGPGGLRTFLESVIVATAAGRPRLAANPVGGEDERRAIPA